MSSIRLPDLYRLDKEALAALDRMAEKSAQNIVDALEISKHTTLARFIFALGNTKCRGNHRKRLGATLSASWTDCERQTCSNCSKLADVGPVVAQSVYDFFREKHNAM